MNNKERRLIMKFTYDEPRMEVLELEPNDIITISGDGSAILPDDEF